MNVESERDEVRAESNGAIGSAYDAKNEVERKERAEVHALCTPGHSDTKWSRQSHKVAAKARAGCALMDFTGIAERRKQAQMRVSCAPPPHRQVANYP